MWVGENLWNFEDIFAAWTGFLILGRKVTHNFGNYMENSEVMKKIFEILIEISRVLKDISLIGNFIRIVQIFLEISRFPIEFQKLNTILFW